MASVIRVKRRRNEDPAEALVLSHKKSRVSDSTDLGVENVLQYAGTLASKDEPVSSHIREAIRTKKIHKEMHPHSSEFKSNHRSNMTSKLRKEKTESSHNSRYRITFSRRALDIDNLDCGKEDCDKDADSISNKPKDSKLLSSLPSCDEDKENAVKLSEGVKESLQNSVGKTAKCENVKDNEDSKSPIAICDSICGAGKDEKVFCLIDVEQDPHHVPKAVASGITMNGVPMTQAKKKVPIAEESDDYVYDLYYTHTRLSDIQNEALVTVQALCEELMLEEREEEGEDFVYDDEDDSNDEDNWRNDYPDEDPHFFENAGKDYDYENDMKENLFHDGEDNGEDDEDEAAMLSYWMDTRCKLDVDYGDFEDNYAKDGSSSDEEAGAELGLY